MSKFAGSSSMLGRIGTRYLSESIVGIATLVLWELAISVLGLIPAGLLPAPSSIILATIELLGSAEFQGHIQATLYRTALASALGVVPGVILGFVMGWSRTAKAALYPPLSAFYPLPKIALLPLFILIFGPGDRAYIITAALGCIFLILLNALRGVEGISEIYIDAARDNGISSRWSLFREILLPGALPLIFTGLRLALGTALVVTVGVEFVAADVGLGYFIWVSYSTYVLTNMWAGIAIVGFFGLVITYGLSYIEQRAIPWESNESSVNVL